MNKFLAVLVLGAMVAVGCDSMKKDDASSEPKKMSVDKSAKSCPASSCDKAK
jgi:hypothetical protein